MKKCLLFLIFSIFVSATHSQVGINTETPQATLDVVGDNSTQATGIIAPRQTRQQLITKGVSYTVNQRGSIVYVTDITGSSAETINITKAGYYYFDGSLWQPFTGQDWSLTGNSGTNPATNFIGTTDSHELIVKTNNVERMAITATGLVGIQTKNPQSIFHIDAAKDNAATGTPSAAQLANDVIVSSNGSVGIGVTPTSKLDVDAQGGNIKIRNLETALPTGLNLLAHTPSDGKVYTTPYNNQMSTGGVAPSSTVTVIDNLKFSSGLVTVTAGNACGRTMIANFTFNGTSLCYMSSIARDVLGQVTIIPIPGNSASSIGYIIKFPNTLGCADGGNGTQFDFTIQISQVVGGSAYFSITNNGNISRGYNVSITRL